MKHVLSKEAKADAAFRIQVAEKFGIKPISLRASKLLNAHCESAEQVKEWIDNKHILKIRQMGKGTLNELFCAFGLCDHHTGGHHRGGQNMLRIACK